MVYELPERLWIAEDCSYRGDVADSNPDQGNSVKDPDSAVSAPIRLV